MVQRQQRNLERPLKYTVTERWGAILVPLRSLIAWKRIRSITFPSSEVLRFGGRSRGKGLGISISNCRPIWGLWAECALCSQCLVQCLRSRYSINSEVTYKSVNQRTNLAGFSVNTQECQWQWVTMYFSSLWISKTFIRLNQIEQSFR